MLVDAIRNVRPPTVEWKVPAQNFDMLRPLQRPIRSIKNGVAIGHSLEIKCRGPKNRHCHRMKNREQRRKCARTELVLRWPLKIQMETYVAMGLMSGCFDRSTGLKWYLDWVQWLCKENLKCLRFVVPFESNGNFSQTKALINWSEQIYPFRKKRTAFSALLCSPWLSLRCKNACNSFRSCHGFHLIPRNEIDSIHLPRSSTTRRKRRRPMQCRWRRTEAKIKRVDLCKLLYEIKWMAKETKRFIHLCAPNAHTPARPNLFYPFHKVYGE